MSKTYEQLITEISETAARYFNGREFAYIQPEEDDEVWQITSGSERSLSGYDDIENTHVDVIEQYVTLSTRDRMHSHLAHYLQVSWGDYDDDEIVTLDLDEGRLNDPDDDTYTDAEALCMAERVLQLLRVVEPTEIYTVPETDLSGLSQYLAEAALERRVVLNKMSAALDDSLLGYVAMIQHRGGELSEEAFDRFVETMKLRHGLTESEVDRTVDLRVQEIMRAESSDSSKERR